MPSGLVALLDDISVIAKAAAASIDDVGAGVAKAGTKAAGVVIDDAAVTPSYVTEFTPDRELPLIWAIAKGSLFNKLIILLPAALLLSQFAPFLITPVLMLGGLYLSFEGAEKVLEKITNTSHGDRLDDDVPDGPEFERRRVSGAVRTDLILSAEIMAISLASVAHAPFLQRAAILALVGVAMTVAVYGAVAAIVKMDDIGLHMVRERGPAGRRIGCFLLKAMPVVLALLSSLGTVAMLWVGGGILLHGAEELGVAGPAHAATAFGEALAALSGPLATVVGWVGYAACAALVGLIAGAVVAMAVHSAVALNARRSPKAA